MTDLLLIESYYNNHITKNIINKYKDNILFCYIDYYNMKYIVDKFELKLYYKFFDILENINNYNIINYYTNDFTNKLIIIRNKSNRIKLYNSDIRLTWLNYYNNYTTNVYKSGSYVWNINKND